ncbi:MAG: pilus assembly protein TadG-related protein [Actinomycetales bacterium]
MSAASRRGRPEDDGQIMILILGYVMIAVLLVIVAVDVTALYLARTQLRDAADATALDAADAADAGAVYRVGVQDDVPLTDETVRSSARSYLETYLPPNHVDRLLLGAATGSPDGRTAVVQLSGRVRLPLLGPVVSAWSGGITVTVESRARAAVDPP